MITLLNLIESKEGREINMKLNLFLATVSLLFASCTAVVENTGTGNNNNDVLSDDEAFRLAVAANAPRHTVCVTTGFPGATSEDFTHTLTATGKESSTGYHSYNTYTDAECSNLYIKMELTPSQKTGPKVSLVW